MNHCVHSTAALLMIPYGSDVIRAVESLGLGQLGGRLDGRGTERLHVLSRERLVVQQHVDPQTGRVLDVRAGGGVFAEERVALPAAVIHTVHAGLRDEQPAVLVRVLLDGGLERRTVADRQPLEDVVAGHFAVGVLHVHVGQLVRLVPRVDPEVDGVSGRAVAHVLAGLLVDQRLVARLEGAVLLLLSSRRCRRAATEGECQYGNQNAHGALRPGGHGLESAHRVTHSVFSLVVSR